MGEETVSSRLPVKLIAIAVLGWILLVAGAVYGYVEWIKIDGSLKYLEEKLEAEKVETGKAVRLTVLRRKEAESIIERITELRLAEAVKRAGLKREIEVKNSHIAELENEAVVIREGFEARIAEIKTSTPSVVASVVEGVLRQVDARSSFQFTVTKLFVANDPAARSIWFGFQEKERCEKLFGNCLDRLEETEEQVVLARGEATSLATVLAGTEEALEAWEKSSKAELAARQHLENQLQTQKAMIGKLSKKLWWNKMALPVSLGGGVAVGYLLGREFGSN